MDDLGPILSEALKAISNWQVAGAVASLAVLTGLLVQITKLPLGQSLLKLVKLDGPARRPWVSAALGGFAAFLGAWGAGAPWVGRLAALLTGALAGWAATGANESRPSSHEDRVILAELKPQNAAKVVELRADVAAANAVTTAPERLKAKAALLDRLLLPTQPSARSET